MREKGYRYRDIAVIAADMNVYADALEKACTAFGIPVFMDHKKSILLNSFVEYVRSLLAMAEQNFTYESVFRHLRTGLCGFTDEEIDRMENYCLALGIKSYKKWQQAWVRRTAWTGEEELQELNHLRVRFVEKTGGLMAILKQRRKTVRDVTLAVYGYIAGERLQEQLAAMEQKFQAEGELALAKEYAQVYRIVLELFDKFVELLGDEKISLKEYCELLDAGLEEAKVGVIPPSMDQVRRCGAYQDQKHPGSLFCGGKRRPPSGKYSGGRAVVRAGQRAVPPGRYQPVPGTEGEDLYPEILFIYEPDKAFGAAFHFLVKGVRRGEDHAPGIPDPGYPCARHT